MKENFNEFLFAIYLFLFAICKIFIRYLTGFSTVILMASTLLILLLSILYNIREKKQKIMLNKNFLFVVFFVILLFLITTIFNYNIYIGQYLYEFLIYGIICMYLFSNVKNYKEFFKYFANIAIFVILLYCTDPFMEFFFFTDYMSFGLTCMLPSFCACCIGRNLFKKKIYFVFEVIAFLEILFFCNRGAIIVAVALELLLYLTATRLSWKKIGFIIFCTIIVVILLLNIEKILLELIKFLDKQDLNSYSIKAIYNMVSGENSGLSGRDTIWKTANNYFKESWIWGHGIGAFQNKYGGYTHNIFFEILTSYGMIGMSIFIVLLLMYIYKIFMSYGYYRILLIAFLIIGIFPLLLSIYTFKWQYFWAFIILSIKKIPVNYKKIKGVENEKYY